MLPASAVRERSEPARSTMHKFALPLSVFRDENLLISICKKAWLRELVLLVWVVDTVLLA